LKDLLLVEAEQQAESSLQRQAEASVLSPSRSKASQQRTAIEHPTTGTASSSAWAPSRLRLSHQNRPLGHVERHQAHGENDGACVKYRTCIHGHDGHSNRERHSLSLEGPGPKAFGGSVRNACFPKHFWVPNNIIKYDSQTNPSVWLEDYYLTCRAGGADSDLFIIQFLPIYLADTSRVWLDYLPKNSIDC
jgi:hypothetical protein